MSRATNSFDYDSFIIVIIVITNGMLFKFYQNANKSMVIMLMMYVGIICYCGYMARKSSNGTIFNVSDGEVVDKERLETFLIMFIVLITLNTFIHIVILW